MDGVFDSVCACSEAAERELERTRERFADERRLLDAARAANQTAIEVTNRIECC